MTTPTFVTQLENLYYTPPIDADGWITIETEDGTELDVDFDFESNFESVFNKLFETHTSLYARWRAAEINNKYVSDRVSLTNGGV